MGLEIRHLYAFIAAADLGSMSKAAKALHVGQPSLSRTIVQVERSVGHTLLDRSSAGCTLTAKGEEFLARARRAVREFETAIEPDDAGRTLTVGYVWSGLGPLTNEIFRQWEATYSRDHLRLKRFDDKCVGVQSGGAALGIVRHETPAIKHRRILFTERRVAAVADNHPLASCKTITMDQFADEVIVINSDTGTTELELWDTSVRPSCPPLLIGSIDEWNHSISLGCGVGVAPESTPAMHPYPGIRYIPLVDAPPVPVYVIWQHDLYNDVGNRFAEVASAVSRTAGTQ